MKRNMQQAAGRHAGIALAIASGVALSHPALAQQALPLNDLSAFQPSSKTWRIAGDVQADLAAANALKPANGTGILVNVPTSKEHGADLFTNLTHGDADIELEYLMAKGSNSGIYLQGRYEIQLLDSWGVTQPRAGDNGGIYERWDDSKPDGQKGYEGHAPRQNVSKAPGLWQKMRISFQAPRFDASGKKIQNARILSLSLNGVTIHEDVELSGPTRGAMQNNEVATGPIRIQGDHGAVAFRNIKITNYDKPRPELTNLKYTLYKGKYQAEPANYASLPPEAEGPSGVISSAVSNMDNEFLIRYTGTLKVAEPGTYTFNMGVNGGGGALRINKQQVIPISEWNGRGTANLPAGELPFELIYSKFVDWAQPSLGLSVSGPGIREYLVSDAALSSGNTVDPILVEAPSNTILRSFMDIPRHGRVVHAVSVGSNKGLHYTYDMDRGNMVQIWRGAFLDATPMWHDRGDGSSRPRGAVQYFGKPAFSVAVLTNNTAAWPDDTTGSSFRTRGYVLDADDQPTFKYDMAGAKIQDALKVAADGQGLQRTITAEGAPANMYVRLAAAANIEPAGKGMYLVDGKAYYLRIDGADGVQLRDAAGGKELVAPLKGTVSYTILY
ncbi:family 16 glycoside hydrolase [Pseudocnuella soli]|uniref:family 16 glycoside hydrolase n=1 Tax=Pseudocnuella soli TaxID=2502779 RepID=UPI00104467BE|nr:family 16 glycoside hydrolase [Pseudocnuella soli]